MQIRQLFLEPSLADSNRLATELHGLVGNYALDSGEVLLLGNPQFLKSFFQAI